MKRELEALERQPLLRAIYALPLLRRLRAAGPEAAGRKAARPEAAGPEAAGPEAAGPEAVGGSEEREQEAANARAHLPQARDELVMRELAAASSHYYVLCVRPNDDTPDAPGASRRPAPQAALCGALCGVLRPRAREQATPAPPWSAPRLGA